jgi:hypothetical protein
MAMPEPWNPAKRGTEEKSDLRPLCADTVEKLDFLPRSQFLRQQADFKKKALRVRQKG